MKLLILTEEQYPFLCGGGNTVLKLFEKYLSEKKIDYDIFCPQWKAGARYPNQRVKALSIPLFIIENKYFRQLYRIPYMLSWFLLSFFYLCFSRKRYDLIFVHENTFSGYYSLFLRLVFGMPIVFMEHSPGTLQAFQDKLGVPNKALEIFEKAINFFRRRVNYMIFVSRTAYNKYKYLNKNSEFIPNSIVSSSFSLKPKRNKVKTLGFSGRLCFAKHVDVMIKVMKKLPDNKLLLIGSGPPEEEGELRKIAKGMKNVVFKGYTTNPNKALDEVDVLFMLWEKESFGIAALEAMAKGIPVIAADVNEMSDFVGRKGGGIVIEPIEKKGFEERIINAVKKINSDKKLYDKLSKQAVKIAKEYDYKSIMPRFVEVFKEAIKKHG